MSHLNKKQSRNNVAKYFIFDRSENNWIIWYLEYKICGWNLEYTKQFPHDNDSIHPHCDVTGLKESQGMHSSYLAGVDAASLTIARILWALGSYGCLMLEAPQHNDSHCTDSWAIHLFCYENISTKLLISRSLTMKWQRSINIDNTEEISSNKHKTDRSLSQFSILLTHETQKMGLVEKINWVNCGKSSFEISWHASKYSRASGIR